MDKKAVILVVDDNRLNVELLSIMLDEEGYQALTAFDGREALEIIDAHEIDVVLLDIVMPEVTGFEVLQKIRQNEATKLIPVVLITGSEAKKDRIRGIELGCDDFITKPFDRYELLARVKSLSKVKAYYDHMRNYEQQLETEVSLRTKELKKALKLVENASLEIIERLAMAAEYKDEDTGAHIRRIGYYAEAIAKELGANKQFIHNILYSAPLHDIGKIGIPDHILLKNGPLTEGERKSMNMHPLIGGEILKGSKHTILQMAEVIARTHHERWDGQGYPNGLFREHIPLEGRIAAVADVFDALISKRPYKAPMPPEKAFSIIQEGKGVQFDPDVVDAFLKIKPKILAIIDRFQSE